MNCQLRAMSYATGIPVSKFIENIGATGSEPIFCTNDDSHLSPIDDKHKHNEYCSRGFHSQEFFPTLLANNFIPVMFHPYLALIGNDRDDPFQIDKTDYIRQVISDAKIGILYYEKKIIRTIDNVAYESFIPHSSVKVNNKIIVDPLTNDIGMTDSEEWLNKNMNTIFQFLLLVHLN